jgi:hypothetical protein
VGKREKPQFFNPELRLTKDEDVERQRLVKQLDKALEAEFLSKKQQTEILAKLRPFYSKPGCKSQWKTFLGSKGLKKPTVNANIKRLQEGWPEVVKKPKPGPNRLNSSRFESSDLALTGKPYPDGKEILEAAFLLTVDEKEDFLEALRSPVLTPEKALEVMRLALVDYVERKRQECGPQEERQLVLADGEPL